MQQSLLNTVVQRTIIKPTGYFFYTGVAFSKHAFSASAHPYDRNFFDYVMLKCRCFIKFESHHLKREYDLIISSEGNPRGSVYVSGRQCRVLHCLYVNIT